MEGPMFSSSLGAMGSLLGKLRSLLVSPEDQLPEPFKSQKYKLELLKQDLEEINSFLLNLSWVEAPNMMVKHWMNEVRDLSYDVEDYIDRRMHPSPSPSSSEDSGSVAEELSTLVKKVNDAHQRHNRYDLGRWASNPRFVVDGQGRGNGDATHLVGIDDSKAELIKRLNIDVEGRLVVCVQGPAGIGKTTLAQEVYREIEGRFQRRAFVRASKMPDTRRLLGSIISQIKPRHQRLSHGLPVQELIDILRTHLLQKRVQSTVVPTVGLEPTTTDGAVAPVATDAAGAVSATASRSAAEAVAVPERPRTKRIAFRTRSEIEILDDGYKWRKYGKKSVKNSPNPRNYYRCSTEGCNVKKRVERDKDDPSYVVTTYEGTHNHVSPSTVYYASQDAASGRFFVAGTQPPGALN